MDLMQCSTTENQILVFPWGRHLEASLLVASGLDRQCLTARRRPDSTVTSAALLMALPHAFVTSTK